MTHALTPLRRRAAASAPVLPAVAVTALLALPLTPGGAGPADVVSGLMVVYCVLCLLRERRRPLPAAAAVVLGLPVVGLALWQGAIGVHQYVTGTGASYQGADIRAVGTFGPQDVMGMATAVALGLVCATGIALGRASLRQRAAAAGCGLALLLPLALSFSRGAWIATALTFAVQLALTGLRRALKVAAAAAAAAVILVGGFGVGSALLQQRIDSIAQVADAPDQSVIDRYTLWASATGIWRQHPLTGVGLKGFPEYRDGHATLALSSGAEIAGAGASYRRQPLLSPHNMYLLVLSEQGLIGLLALAGSWLALLVRALRGLPRVRDRGPGLDCALIACGLLVWQLTDYVYADIGGPSTVLTGMALGLVAWWTLGGAQRDPAVPRDGVHAHAEEAVAR